MLMNNANNSHGGVGGADPFDKNRLRVEADRERKAKELEIQQREEKKKQEERKKEDERKKHLQDLQIQISALERELVNSKSNLQTKHPVLLGLKKDLDTTKRDLFLLEGKIKSIDGSGQYLKNEASVQGSHLSELEAETDKKTQALAKVVKELQALEAELAQKKNEKQALEQDINHLKIDAKQVDSGSGRLNTQLENKRRDIEKLRQEVLLQTRTVNQQEQDFQTVSQLVQNLERQIAEKERNLQALIRQKEALKY